MELHFLLTRANIIQDCQKAVNDILVRLSIDSLKSKNRLIRPLFSHIYSVWCFYLCIVYFV